jgi:hypothetical protein
MSCGRLEFAWCLLGGGQAKGTADWKIKVKMLSQVHYWIASRCEKICALGTPQSVPLSRLCVGFGLRKARASFVAWKFLQDDWKTTCAKDCCASVISGQLTYLGAA